MKTILFQGDSITDCDRDRERHDNLGNGYPRLIEAELGYENPNTYIFQNRGVSGDRVPDVYSRIVSDIIRIKPDYMSILIGVNDVWRAFDSDCGTGLERFEKVYNILIEEIKSELPEVKIMIMEPFVLRGHATDATEDYPERYKDFRSGVIEMAAAAKRVAEKHNLKFIELQSKFDEAEKTAPAEYWLSDGVHPTAKGHELIKREWLKAFGEIKATES